MVSGGFVSRVGIMSTNLDPVRGDAQKPLTEQVTFWSMMIHLSIFTGFFTGVGFFLGPLLIWLIQKHQFPALENHFKEAINFQISIFIYSLILGGLTLVTFGLAGVITVPGLLVLAGLNILFPILAGVKARDGLEYRYPMSIRIV